MTELQRDKWIDRHEIMNNYLENEKAFDISPDETNIWNKNVFPIEIKLIWFFYKAMILRLFEMLRTAFTMHAILYIEV